MTMLGVIGQGVIGQIKQTTHVFALLGTTLMLAARRRFWPRTTRAVFARQILFTGVEAMKFVSLVAFMTGISVVVQAQVWLGKAGQSAMLGPVLVAVIVREVAPLLVNFIVIARSGTAMATELATMKVYGEIRVLEAQGLDSLLYLAMPRILAMAICIFCLTTWFVAVSFASGYLSGIVFGVSAGDPADFLNSILKGVRPADIYNLLAKTLIPGMFTATFCVIEGMSVRYSITEVPQAATRAVVRSIAALFIISALVSVLTYL